MPIFQLSPGVKVSEFDTTTSVPAVSTSVGGFVGVVNWGPANKIVTVSSPVDFANRYSAPDDNTAISFFTATNFLSYSNNLKFARVANSVQRNAIGGGATPLNIPNEDYYFNNYYATTQANTSFTARYPSSLGNSLEVMVWANGAVWTANSSNTNDPLYNFANYFNWAPNTTPYVAQVSNSAVTGDEMHVLVIDQDGQFTGTANTILEVYQGLSRLYDAKDVNGQSNYYKDVLFRKSRYVYQLGHPSANVQGWGATISTLPTFVNDANANVVSFIGGVTGAPTDGDVMNAYALFINSQNVNVDLIMTGGYDTTVGNYVIDNVAEEREDCVCFLSASLAADQDAVSPAAAIASYVNSISRSSYAIVDTGWKYQYDQYNDKYRWIPLNADVAGLCAATDNARAPWWSPAGLQRGIIKNVVKLAFNPGQTDRDTLYPLGVNPVVSFEGEGTMLFGDKTFLNYSSAFDHINVRRLFVYLEKTIAKAARASLFEFNDVFTRAQFVNLVTPFLRGVKGGRGITDFLVVCDTSNNTGDIIDGNGFVGDIYIKPAKSINYIQLNFVAVGTSVDFNTIVGNFGG